MIATSVLKKKIWEVISKYAEVNVIWEKQAEARPPKPYISLDIVAGPIKKGLDDERVDPNDNKVYFVGFRELTLSVNYFGTNSYEGLCKIQQSLVFPTAREMFLSHDIVVVKDSGIRDLSSLMENRFESRSEMDVTLRIKNYAKDNETYIIERVDLENEIDNSLTTISVP